jgi:hypothetical protein
MSKSIPSDSAVQSDNSEPIEEVPGATKGNDASATKGNDASATKGNGAGAAVTDPTDLLSLAIDPATYLQSGAVTRVRQILAGRPGPQTFFRVHPSPDYRRAYKMVEIKEERENYIVMPAFESEISEEIVVKMIYTTIDRNGTICLWPARLPHEDDRKSMLWYKSAHEAAATGMEKWIRMRACMADGAYETLIADSEIPEPDWKGLPSFGDLLIRAFGNRVINSIDHSAIKLLRGKL